MLHPLFNSSGKIYISGPCSAETEDQVIATAIQLSTDKRIHLLRAGIWKPRTNPDSFEGVGEIGLPWLKRAKEMTGLPVTTEVANARHVEKALEYEIDVLWIGARTTVNPFQVQEIADALKGVSVPVMIKNPISPDIDLWQGAIDRLIRSGINDIALIHRGFKTYGPTIYRNTPLWQLPIEMKRRHPEIPMICDPSHICGNRSLIAQTAQISIDLDFSGLMIESHPDPDHAWSDAAQQLKPNDLFSLLDSLVWRSPSVNDHECNHALAEIRSEMDKVDANLVQLLGERMKLAEAIGLCKKENNITILQTARWNEIRAKLLEKAAEFGLSEAFIHQYIDAVHMESITHQNKIMNS